MSLEKAHEALGKWSIQLEIVQGEYNKAKKWVVDEMTKARVDNKAKEEKK